MPNLAVLIQLVGLILTCMIGRLEYVAAGALLVAGAVPFRCQRKRRGTAASSATSDGPSRRWPLLGGVGVFLLTAPICVFAREPNLPHFDPQTTKVAFIENGDSPLSYTTGVIDAKSFWKQYGGSVGTNVGGVVGTAISSQSTAAAIRHPNGDDSPARQILGENQLAPNVNAAVIKQLAAAWGFSFNPDQLVVLRNTPAIVDPNTKLVEELKSDAQLVLMTEVHNVNLTERFSMGGALAAGISFGTSKKSLTTEVSVVVRAIQHDAGTGTYRQIWSEVCGTNYTTMKTSYPLKDLVESHDKVMEIVNEATEQSIARCGRRLAAFKAPQSEGRPAEALTAEK